MPPDIRMPGQASAVLAAIVAPAHQTSSSSAFFADGRRLASISSIGLLAPIEK